MIGNIDRTKIKTEGIKLVEDKRVTLEMSGLPTPTHLQVRPVACGRRWLVIGRPVLCRLHMQYRLWAAKYPITFILAEVIVVVKVMLRVIVRVPFLRHVYLV